MPSVVPFTIDTGDEVPLPTFTVNLAVPPTIDGLVTPIPTLPEESIRIFSEELMLNRC